MCPSQNSQKKNRLRKLKFAFNKLVIEIAVTCYIFKIMAHERKFKQKSMEA